MTVAQASHFTCDRCKKLDVVPSDNSGPVINRMAGPAGWTMLRIGSDPGTPPSHFCPACSTAFADFLKPTVS
jgi:hypothetical protein